MPRLRSTALTALVLAYAPPEKLKQTVSQPTSKRYARPLLWELTKNCATEGNAMSLPPLQTMLEAVVGATRRFAPYLLTELLLPGGTLLALMLYLSRLRRARLDRAAERSTRSQSQADVGALPPPVSRRRATEALLRRVRLSSLRRLRARLPARGAISALGLAPRS